jgi:outer membrane protein TolC
MFLIPTRVAALAIALLPVAGDAASLSLDQALTLAVQRSAAARAARAETTSTREAAYAAGRLPDPTFSLGVDNLPVTGADRFSTTADSQTMKRIGISQEWVAQDKREARRAAADAAVDRQAATADAAVADTRLQTALAYVDAYYGSETLRLATVDEHHADEAIEAAKARLASSSGDAQDVLALTAARGLAEDDTADARQSQVDAALALQRWVGVPVDQLEPPGMGPTPSQASYVAASPAVRSAQREVEVARREAAIAASERQPDWSWQLSYGQRSGYPDMLSFGVSIPLPVARAARQDRQVAARLALIEKAEAQLEEARRAAAAEYQALDNDAQRLGRRIERLRSTVVAPAHQRTEVALAGYRSTGTPLATLFEARHLEVDAQRKLATLQRDLARAQARLAYTPVIEGVRP